jgi:hypothetical protein
MLYGDTGGGTTWTAYNPGMCSSSAGGVAAFDPYMQQCNGPQQECIVAAPYKSHTLAVLSDWRSTPAANFRCAPTVGDAFGLGQQVPAAFSSGRGGVARPGTKIGWAQCVDGQVVRGPPQRDDLLYNPM